MIILGTGGSLHFCDFNYRDGEKLPNSEVWGVNGSYTIERNLPNLHKGKFSMDKLFMGDHLWSHENGTLYFDIDDLNKFSEDHNCQIISCHKMKLGKHVLNAKPYPYNKIVQYFHTDYFTDSVCYMLAYLLYTHTYLARNPQGIIRPELKEPVNIRFFGIDMNSKREYQQSKGGVEYWLGMAWSLGCTFENAPGSSILMNPCGVPYGRWELFKVKYKDCDPLGMMKGNIPTAAECDVVQEKLKAELRPGIKEVRL